MSAISTDKPSRVAPLALLMATIGWGAGFTWAKAAGEAINARVGVSSSSAVGQLWFVGIRFLITAAFWFAIFPASRRGWTVTGLARGSTLGTLLALGLILQHAGLAHTSEAVAAFLTSLVVVFTPILSTIVFRKPPPAIVWIGVIVAMAGVWLLNGASLVDFGWGQALGIGCAIVFTVHAVAINTLVPKENPWRMTGIQFVFVGIAALVVSMPMEGSRELFKLSGAMATLSTKPVMLNLVLLILLPTLLSFGLAMHFQPRVEVTRAVLIYLMEPIFASGFAYILVGHALSRLSLAGAGLIVVANLLVELVSARRNAKQIPVTEVM